MASGGVELQSLAELLSKCNRRWCDKERIPVMTIQIVPLTIRPEYPCYLLKIHDTLNIILDCAAYLVDANEATTVSSPQKHGVHTERGEGSSCVNSGKRKFVDSPTKDDPTSISTASTPSTSSTPTSPTSAHAPPHAPAPAPSPYFSLPYDLANLDASTIDVVLISHPDNMIGLPYVTEYMPGFEGKVFATDPTVEFGGLALEELGTMIRATSQSGSMRESGGMILIGDEARPWYTPHDIKSCISKIKRVHFYQPMRINGEVTITASSSGYSLGATNWIIDVAGDKIVYTFSPTVSNFGHSRPLDAAAFDKAEIVIANNVAWTQGDVDESVGEICVQVARTVEKNGNVIIPIDSFGTVFDLIDVLSRQLYHIGFTQLPMHIVSPVAKRSLHIANILGEWMNPSVQTNLYKSQTPLLHGGLMEQRRLIHHDSVHTVFNHKGPYVIFVGHSSMKFGDVVHLVRAWGGDQDTSVVLTDPKRFGAASIPAELTASKMMVHWCPIERRMNPAQMLDLCQARGVRRLFVPGRDLASLKSMGKVPVVSMDEKGTATVVADLDELQTVALDAVFAEGFINEKLATKTIMTDQSPMARVSASMIQQGGYHNLGQFGVTGSNTPGR
ncbi:Integrator complex subunit 9 [Quaeritorhiza haematococci]|nr:Integrator complex subunit 9 [Quaeritorhiza haematococci]